MEHLQLLSKVLRYAGLNLTPQIIQIVLDEPTRTLIENLDKTLKENPNPSLEDIDAIVNEIQEAQEKAAKAEAAKNVKPAKGKLLDKK